MERIVLPEARKHVTFRFPQPPRTGDVVMRLEGVWAGNALAFKKHDGRMVYVIHHPFATPGSVRIGGASGTVEFTLEPQSINTIIESTAG